MSRSRDRYHHGDLAEALERAAMELLGDRPASEISLRAVARAADVSHNAPYHHFSDRRGLLKVLAERSMVDLVAAVHARTDGPVDPVAAVRGGGAAYVRFASERTHAFDTIYDPAVCVPGEPTETMAPLIADLEATLARVATVAGLRGEPQVNGLWGLMHGLATLAAAGHLTLDQALAGYDAVVLRMLDA